MTAMFQKLKFTSRAVLSASPRLGVVGGFLPIATIFGISFGSNLSSAAACGKAR